HRYRAVAVRADRSMGGEAGAPPPGALHLRLLGRPLYLTVALGAYGSVTPTPASRPGALHATVWFDPTASAAASCAPRPAPHLPHTDRARVLAGTQRHGSGAPVGHRIPGQGCV